jgi:predicted KAP-like P-loop ATPase
MANEREQVTMFLSDQETKVDLLNNEAIAVTIVRLLCDRPDHPVTVGVHGDWGAGKSSILEMIEVGLDKQKSVLCLKFNGWRFQGFEDAKIALIESIVTGLVEKRPALAKASGVVKDVFRRIDWLKVAKKAGGLALTVFTGIPTADQINAITSSLQGALADPAALATKENIEAALAGVQSLIKSEPETKNIPEEIGEFRKAFDSLLKEAGVKRLVVLIDDLDRCLPDTAIETLEAVRLFVFTAGTAFVVAADEAMIEYAVRRHFPELPDTTGPQTYARNYLEKLIQVPFRIPSLGETETRIYVTLLLIGAELGEDDPAFGKLIVIARERLKKPWEAIAFDAATVRIALGDQAGRAQNALTLSDQIGPILASGTKGNPRQIKRFLNTLMLRQRIAEARGFGDEVKLPVLAKLMLAERFLPRLFDQIATTTAASPKGLCDDLALLEAAVGEAPKGAVAAKVAAKDKTHTDGDDIARPKSPKPDEALFSAEWLSSKPIRAWAAIKPPLAGIDLRPYLFVTKDRKDYFGSTSALGHLAAVVEQLFGSKFAVQGLETSLKQLAGPEAEQVFEAVRTRIIASDALETEPPGIAGLMVLVRAHPALQANLVDLLESLPADEVGAWAVQGWGSVITNAEPATRLAQLIGSWATSSQNSVLKTAATAAQRLKPGRR